MQRRATATGKHRIGVIRRLVGIMDAITAGVQTKMSANWHVFVRSFRKNFVKILSYITDVKFRL